LFFFSPSFSLDEKEAKNRGKKTASVSERTSPRTRLQLARFFANPTHTANGVFIQKYFSLNLLNKGLGL
jgi:hypothetical protein